MSTAIAGTHEFLGTDIKPRTEFTVVLKTIAIGEP